MTVLHAAALRRQAALLAACLLTACSGVEPSSTPTPPGKTITADTVVLTEGTNLAVAINPVNGDKVIALQAALYLQKKGETDARVLTRWADDAWEPDFHPAGQQVVYESYRDGSFDLWQLNPYDGSTPIQLTKGPFDDREPQYSPDGQRIIFSSDRAGSCDIWELHTMAENGKPAEPVQLTALEGDAHAPTWHPGGEGFAYLVSDRRGSAVYWQRPGAKVEQLLQSQSRFSGLQFLPSGTSLSLRSLDRDPEGNALSSLSRLDLTGGTLTPLTPVDADVFPFRAQWQSDGSALFTSDGQIKRWSLDDGIETEPFRVEIPVQRPRYARKQRDFDSTAPRPVLGISYPTLSRDGATVAFTALGDLYLWDIEQRTLRQITDDPAADQTPAWSRDGRRLSWISDRAGRYAVWTLDLDSGAIDSLAFERKFISFPAWSPDGSQLAFFTDVPANPLLHVVGQLSVYNLATGALTPLLAPMPPQPINWSADGNYLVTTRLKPYSQRFREGLYAIVAANITTGEAHDIVPTPHRSVTHATLAPGAEGSHKVAYSQDGTLNLQLLNSELKPLGEPQLLVNSLADMPSFSHSGEYIAYLAGRDLYRLHLPSGKRENIS
ncbi:MAG: hypothetical protein V2J89_06355, partial [Halieaceae bacterium]|nr:hypothetical protein [Halieaceae bacterium]